MATTYKLHSDGSAVVITRSRIVGDEILSTTEVSPILTREHAASCRDKAEALAFGVARSEHALTKEGKSLGTLAAVKAGFRLSAADRLARAVALAASVK